MSKNNHELEIKDVLELAHGTYSMRDDLANRFLILQEKLNHQVKVLSVEQIMLININSLRKYMGIGIEIESLDELPQNATNEWRAIAQSTHKAIYGGEE